MAKRQQDLDTMIEFCQNRSDCRMDIKLRYLASHSLYGLSGTPAINHCRDAIAQRFGFRPSHYCNAHQQNCTGVASCLRPRAFATTASGAAVARRKRTSNKRTLSNWPETSWV
jgi:hypothetical protein